MSMADHGASMQSTASNRDHRDRAERWFVRLLEPECPDIERAAFERWRNADPAHAAAYREVERLWADSEEAAKDPRIVAASMRALRLDATGPGRFRGWLMPVAIASAAAVAAVAILPRWLTPAEAPSGTRHATAVGELRDLTMPDGSVVKLDTASVVVERYGGRQRRLDLERGQAQFDVASDPEKPFVVHVGNGTVTAIGTEFQVRTMSEGTTVTLLEGEVAVAAWSATGATYAVRLQAGERLSFDRNGRITSPEPADLRAARGWTEGRLLVHDWRLEELLAEMNRYADVQLRVHDPSLRDIRISGTFRTGDQDTLASILEQGWSLRAERAPGQTIVLSRQ